MIIIETINGGHVTSCRSEDGLVTALACPTTTLYGDFSLVDAGGRHMDRGVYMDYTRALGEGFATTERVPDHIWASAVRLMHDWTDHQRVRQEAAAKRSLDRDLARYDGRAEEIAWDMDQADSAL